MPGTKNKHSWISVCSVVTPSNLQTHHKGSLSSLPPPRFSFRRPSCLGFYSCLHLVLSFPVRASKFVCFQASHIFLFLSCFFLQDNLHVSLLFHFAPCLFCTWDYSSSLFLFISLLLALISLSLAPYFLSLDSPVPISVPFDQTSSPNPLRLRQLKKHSRLEWNRKNTVERELKGGSLNPGKGVSGPVTSPSLLVPGPSLSLPLSACVPGGMGQQQEGSRKKGEDLGLWKL